jgi:XapX domain-containing protein
MTGYFVSLLMGLIVGMLYALVQVRSPAPPLIALVGLFGMVLGQQAVDMARRHFEPTPQISTGQPPGKSPGASLGGTLVEKAR